MQVFGIEDPNDRWVSENPGVEPDYAEVEEAVRRIQTVPAA